MNSVRLKKYAQVLLEIGVNFQKNQILLLQTCTDALDLARCLTDQAFAMGAKDVIVHLEDAQIEHLRALHCNKETLKELPEWKKESLDYYLCQDCVQMSLMGSYPTLNEDVSGENLLAKNASNNELRNVVRKHIHAGTLKWTGTVYPNVNWAKKVYPELNEKEALIQLEEALCKMMRIDDESDPVENWHDHCEEVGMLVDCCEAVPFIEGDEFFDAVDCYEATSYDVADEGETSKDLPEDFLSCDV